MADCGVAEVCTLMLRAESNRASPIESGAFQRNERRFHGCERPSPSSRASSDLRLPARICYRELDGRRDERGLIEISGA